jgi:hypothetical protein
MTTATPRPPLSGTRAAIQQGRRTRAPNLVANRWLAVLTILLVVVAIGLGVFAFLTWHDANDIRDATKPLEARTAQLHADVGTADTAIDRLTELFAAVKAQSDATATAVDTANKAAQQYNTAQTGIADAFGANVASVGTALTQSTTAVRTAAENARGVLGDLARATGDPTNG